MLKHNEEPSVTPRRVVVVGAGGFIGKTLVGFLAKRNIPHVTLTSNKLNLLMPDAAEQLSGLLDPEDTLVAISAIAPCKDNNMLIKNISMMVSVCAAIEKSPPKHVIYISSDAVYADSTKPLTESSCAEPASLHGVMHLTREVMLKNICKMPLAILRPTLIYGPGDTHNGYGPNQFYRLATAAKDIILFGAGEEQRDHIYIEDVVEIISLVINHRSEGLLNIATGVVTSFYEVAKMIVSQHESPVVIKTTPRKGPMPHNGYRSFDVTAIHAAFPGFCYTTLQEGLRRMSTSGE